MYQSIMRQLPAQCIRLSSIHNGYQLSASVLSRTPSLSEHATLHSLKAYRSRPQRGDMTAPQKARPPPEYAVVV